MLEKGMSVMSDSYSVLVHVRWALTHLVNNGTNRCIIPNSLRAVCIEHIMREWVLIIKAFPEEGACTPTYEG